jgi:long-chain acyl-CoA synthetase
VRKGKESSALARFEKILGTSPAFRTLHEKWGAELPAFLNEKIEIIEGDVSFPRLGMLPSIASRLQKKIDLVVNCAGLVDFEPDLREALSVNVTGSLNALEFTQRCEKAGLVHISTAYVCGRTDGSFVQEERIPNYSPNGKEFFPEIEYEEALRQVQEDPKLKRDWYQLAKDRAQRWNWPNGYTYTKSLAESLIQNRAGKLPFTFLRPAIVESSLEFPFPGWNEGAETCTPISYLAGTWLRHFTARKNYTLDLIPVDEVCKALTVAGAAVMSGEHRPVYHCASSYRNPIKLGRMLELISLAHRAFYRDHGNSMLERLVLSRWDAVTVSEKNLFTASRLRDVAIELNRVFNTWEARASGPLKEWIHSIVLLSHRSKWALIKAAKILSVFIPFIYDTNYRFVAENLENHKVEEEAFRFNPAGIDWRNYILNIHEPGIRKWCYPILENKPVEKYQPSYPFHLADEGAGLAQSNLRRCP